MACEAARKSAVHLILAEVGTSPRSTCAGMRRVMGGVMVWHVYISNVFRSGCERIVNEVLGDPGTVRVSIGRRNTLTFNHDQTGRGNDHARWIHGESAVSGLRQADPISDLREAE